MAGDVVERDGIVGDASTGEIIADRREQPIPPNPPELPPLKTPEQVLEEIRQESLRMDLVARRLAESSKELHGDRQFNRETREWEWSGGLELSYESAVEEETRGLWRQYLAGEIKKWPGEDVRRAIAHEEMDPNVRLRYMVVKEERKRLEIIQRLLAHRMDGLRTMLSYHKETAKLAGTSGYDEEPAGGVLDG